MMNSGDSANDDDVDLESTRGQDLGDNAEEVEEKEGEKTQEKADYCGGEDVELTNKHYKKLE